MGAYFSISINNKLRRYEDDCKRDSRNCWEDGAESQQNEKDGTGSNDPENGGEHSLLSNRCSKLLRSGEVHVALWLQLSPALVNKKPRSLRSSLILFFECTFFKALSLIGRGLFLCSDIQRLCWPFKNHSRVWIYTKIKSYDVWWIPYSLSLYILAAFSDLLEWIKIIERTEPEINEISIQMLSSFQSILPFWSS